MNYVMFMAMATVLAAMAVPARPAKAAPVNKIIPVPFVSQIPYGTWTAPWNSACEEASIVMLERYYSNVSQEPRSETVSRMNRYFAVQNKLYGSHRDSDAYRTTDIINGYALTFRAYVKENPSLSDIQEELRHNRPVLVPVYGRGLKNTAVPFAADSSSYHMIVLIGFDQETSEFVAHEPAMVTGSQQRYGYKIVLNSMHDYMLETDTANGPPRAIFTEPASEITTSSLNNIFGLVKAVNSRRIYWIQEGQRYYISHPRVVKNHGWKWSSLRTINKDALERLPLAGVIDR